MAIVTLIMPYGVFLSGDTEYRRYLDSAVRIIKSNKTDVIVTCSGFSNKNMPKLSEAASIRGYLIDREPSFENKIVYEEESLSTLQGIEFSRNLLIDKKVKINKLNIICDSIRAAKVFFSAIYAFGELVNNEKYSEEKTYELLARNAVLREADLTTKITFNHKNLNIIGIPLDRSKKEIAQQIVSTLEEIAFIKYPKLHQEFITYRKIKWALNRTK